jgi:hypothetical protein
VVTGCWAVMLPATFGRVVRQPFILAEHCGCPGGIPSCLVTIRLVCIASNMANSQVPGLSPLVTHVRLQVTSMNVLVGIVQQVLAVLLTAKVHCCLIAACNFCTGSKAA